MPNPQAEEFYQKGLNALCNGHLYLALICFEQAVNLERVPRYCSHLAFCLAKARGQFQEAISLCNEALEGDPDDPVHYLNLGRVFVLAGQRRKALQTLRQGLPFDGNGEILRELDMLGKRKPPVFPALKREHPLNKYLGILLKKLGIR